jgi:hypothetical protein
MNKKRPNLVRKKERIEKLKNRRLRAGRLAMEALGVSELVSRVPGIDSRIIASQRFPRPIVTMDPSATANADAVRLGAKVESLIDTIMVPIEAKATVSFADFFTIYAGIAGALGGIASNSGGSPIDQRIVEACSRAREFYSRHLHSALNALSVEIAVLGLTHFPIDGPRLRFSVTRHVDASGRHTPEIRLSLRTPETIEVEIDGKSRRAYRCAAQFGPPDIELVSWSGLNIGDNKDDRSYPVFIQPHAIRRFSERTRVLGDAARVFLYLSMLDPRVVERQGDDFLVEYRWAEKRIGYLVAKRMRRVIVVTSFLFLTMQGTPESKLLSRVLRLGRADIEYQRLDDLNTFLNTDLRNDPVLVRLLSNCGCGHLLHFPKLVSEGKVGYADELRKYLRLDKRRAAKAMQYPAIYSEPPLAPTGFTAAAED